MTRRFPITTRFLEFKKKVPQVRQEMPKESQRVHRPKRSTDNNEDEDNSPNSADNTNHQASSQTFREK